MSTGISMFIICLCWSIYVLFPSFGIKSGYGAFLWLWYQKWSLSKYTYMSVLLVELDWLLSMKLCDMRRWVSTQSHLIIPVINSEVVMEPMTSVSSFNALMCFFTFLDNLDLSQYPYAIICRCATHCSVSVCHGLHPLPGVLTLGRGWDRAWQCHAHLYDFDEWYTIYLNLG